VMAHPFMPGSAEKIIAMLGLAEERFSWAAPAPLPVDHPLGEPVILFEKLEQGCMD